MSRNPPRGFIKQVATPVPTAPSAESPSASAQNEPGSRLSLDPNANSIRSIQEKIHSEFRNGKTALPLAKGVDEERQRTSSDVVKSRVQNIEGNLKASPTALPIPKVPSPAMTPRASMSRPSIPNTNSYSNQNPSNHESTPTVHSSWHTKSMLSTFSDAFGLNAQKEPSPKSVTDVAKNRNSLPATFSRSTYDNNDDDDDDDDDDGNRNPIQGRPQMQKRKSYTDITQDTLKQEDKKIDITKSSVEEQVQVYILSQSCD